MGYAHGRWPLSGFAEQTFSNFFSDETAPVNSEAFSLPAVSRLETPAHARERREAGLLLPASSPSPANIPRFND